MAYIEKEAREFKRSIKFFRGENPTQIVAVAIGLSITNNSISKLPLRRCLLLRGYSTDVRVVPIGSYTYDNGTDSFLVNCYDYADLGTIPFSYFISMNQTGGWKIQVPIPVDLISKNLKEFKREQLDEFKSKYSGDEYRIEYLQFIHSS